MPTGKVLAGEGEYEKTAFYIHSRIHLANPHAACVLHTHMPYATALTLLEGGRLEMVEQNALRFHDDIAYDDSTTAWWSTTRKAIAWRACSAAKRVHVPRQPRRDRGRRRASPRRSTRCTTWSAPAGCRCWRARWAAGCAPVRPEVVRTAYRMMRDDAPKYAGAHFDALKRILDREEPAYSR